MDAVDDHKLLDVVREHGGPPPQFNSRKFWARIHADRRLAKWRTVRGAPALRERYRRLAERLQRQTH